MRTGMITQLDGDRAVVVFSDIDIQKPAIVLAGVTVSVGDTVLVACIESMQQCFVLGGIE